jgi:hypothetical protein
MIPHPLQFLGHRLPPFVEESNAIEGILRAPTAKEVRAYATLLRRPELTVQDLVAFADAICGARLRLNLGDDVTVGSHRSPPGGPNVGAAVADLLVAIQAHEIDAYDAHVEFVRLHPFIDGDGRVGRALWAWQMLRELRDPFSPGFLHRWYHDSLDVSSRERLRSNLSSAFTVIMPSSDSSSGTNE